MASVTIAFELLENGYVNMNWQKGNVTYYTLALPSCAYIGREKGDNEILIIQDLNGGVLQKFNFKDVNGDNCTPTIDTTNIDNFISGLMGFFNPNITLNVDNLVGAIENVDASIGKTNDKLDTIIEQNVEVIRLLGIIARI